MLSTAQRRAPECRWLLADVATVDLARTFDVVVMAGNVMLFVDPGTEGTVLANLARHVAPGGVLVAGFEVHPRGFTLERYDALAADAGLALAERWATWDPDPWAPGGRYAVSVHRPA
jgi:trans-aconitate methyltransferase